jgi:CheY-like chemotaxis protein
MDGVEACEIMKRQGGPKATVVFVPLTPLKNLETECLSGCIRLVSKPFNIEI